MLTIASDQSPVHRPIINSQTFLSGPDESVLDGLIDGEQRNVVATIEPCAATIFRERLRPTSTTSNIG